MTHLHIVEPYHSRAMLAMSQPLVELTGFESVTIGEQANSDADINYHIPWHTLDGMGPTNSLQGMLYTHVNPPAKESLVRACRRADFIVAMSNAGKDELLSLGVNKEKITVIYAGHTDYQPRPLRIGVIGYEQPNGRKRGHILLDLCWMMDVSPFEFVIVGGGWDDIVAKMQNAGARVAYLADVEQEKMQEIYDYIDILLVTSYVEGGPLTVLESLGAGKRVIAPPVGYALDLLDSDDLYISVDGLVEILNAIKFDNKKRLSVLEYTWSRYASEHEKLFKEVLSCQPTYI